MSQAGTAGAATACCAHVPLIRKEPHLVHLTTMCLLSPAEPAEPAVPAVPRRCAARRSMWTTSGCPQGPCTQVSGMLRCAALCCAARHGRLQQALHGALHCMHSVEKGLRATHLAAPPPPPTHTHTQLKAKYAHPLAAFVLSTKPHARLLSVDAVPAFEVPGVAGVFTAKDVPGGNDIGVAIHDEELFATVGIYYLNYCISNGEKFQLHCNQDDGAVIRDRMFSCAS